MKFARLLRSVAFGSAILLGLSGCGREAKLLQAENEALRAGMAEAAARAEAEAQVASARTAQVKQLEADAQDVLRLRAEVVKLRSATKDTENVRAENQRLKLENQALRQGTAAAAPAAGAPTPGHFPKESWSYAGYQTPETALVSAL